MRCARSIDRGFPGRTLDLFGDATPKEYEIIFQQRQQQERDWEFNPTVLSDWTTWYHTMPTHMAPCDTSDLDLDSQAEGTAEGAEKSRKLCVWCMW